MIPGARALTQPSFTNRPPAGHPTRDTMLRALASRGRQLKQLRSLAVRGYATEAGKTGKSVSSV